MNIKSKIEGLTIEQRRLLAHSFDNIFSQYIEFGDNEFIGVHLDISKNKNLQILDSVGVWSYGKIQRDII